MLQHDGMKAPYTIHIYGFGFSTTSTSLLILNSWRYII
jgi:hypothetical protein